MQKIAVEDDQIILSDAQNNVARKYTQDKHGKAKQFSWWMMTEHVLAAIAWNG